MPTIINAVPTHPDANSYLTLVEANALIGNRPGVDAWTELTDDQKERLLVDATLNIDSYRFFNRPLYEYPRDYRNSQALKFPQQGCRMANGKPSTQGTNFFTDTNLANKSDMPDDYWNGGAVIITLGGGKGKTYQIADFIAEHGHITIFGNFDPAIDSSSYYRLVPKIPSDVKMATIEQALFLIGGGADRAMARSQGVEEYQIGDLRERFGSGGGSASFDQLPFSPIAKTYLRKYISKIGRMVAGPL